MVRTYLVFGSALCLLFIYSSLNNLNMIGVAFGGPLGGRPVGHASQFHK